MTTRLPGTLVTFDGPGGVGKTTTTALVASQLNADGVSVHSTAQPSCTPLGELARHGTDTFRDMALACLCAADRHQQLTTEILPALSQGKVVLCDRYLAASLVLQGLDDIPAERVWSLNHDVYVPDLAIVLTESPSVINRRLRARGGHSRFERAADNSVQETIGYQQAMIFLSERGWPIRPMACDADAADTAAKIVDLVHQIRTESPACR